MEQERIDELRSLCVGCSAGPFDEDEYRAMQKIRMSLPKLIAEVERLQNVCKAFVRALYLKFSIDMMQDCFYQTADTEEVK